MTIWWCEEHEMAALRGSWSYCAQAHYWPGAYGPTRCRMIQMDLVPHETLLTGVTAADVIMDELA